MTLVQLEVWTPIEGFDDSYEVSNLGRVRSIDREIIDVKGQRRKYKGRILRHSVAGNGYSRICLWEGSRQYGAYVHRLVAGAFLRDIEDYEEVNHLDFDKGNNAVNNLEIVTRLENMQHAAITGRFAKKLCSDQVSEIKTSLTTNESRQIIADRFGVSYRLIRLIDIGELWQHVPSG